MISIPIISNPSAPHGLNSILWSEDCDIACNSFDSITILTPRLSIAHHNNSNKNNNSNNNNNNREKLWDEQRIRTNEFTDDEVPGLTTSASHSLSIGEELSESLTVDISWSPTGLDTFDHCALGVLTSNLILSIWSRSFPSNKSSLWERVLVINKSLPPTDESIADDNLKRRLRRIRSFSWSPIINKEYLLATGNDELQIIILKVESNPKWKSIIFKIIDLKCQYPSLSLPNHSWTFENFITQTRFAKNICWSPLYQENQSTYFFLTYSLSDKIIFQKLLFNNTTKELQESKNDTHTVQLPDGAIVRSFLKFDKHNSSNILNLCCQVDHEFVCYSMNSGNIKDFQSYKYPLTSWDEISCIAYSSISSESRIVHVLNSNGSTDISLTLPFLKPLPAQERPWKYTINELKNQFDDSYQLGNLIYTKYFGLDTSLFGDVMALNFTLKPTDVPVYYAPSERKSHVLVVPSSEQITFMSKNSLMMLNVEAFVLFIKLYMESFPRDRLLLTLNAVKRVLIDDVELDGDSELLEKRCDGLEESELIELFQNILLSKYSKTKQFRQVLGKMIELDNTAVPDGSIQKDMSTVKLKVFLQNLSSLDLDDWSRKVCQLYDVASGDESSVREQCDICQEIILFNQTDSAECLNGHKFDRCSLTLLAIQAPDISKRCGICERYTLDESKIDWNNLPWSLNERNDNFVRESNTKLSLVQILLKSLSTCSTCGGKFKG